MADFNVDALISEVTGGADSTSTVRVADGAVSQAKGKSGRW